jgi:hypothetical protein
MPHQRFVIGQAGGRQGVGVAAQTGLGGREDRGALTDEGDPAMTPVDQIVDGRPRSAPVVDVDLAEIAPR